MSIIFRIYLTLNALFLVFVVFAIKDNIYFKFFYTESYVLPSYISFGGYFIFSLLSTKFGLYLSNYLSEDSIDKGSIISIEPANDSFLPSYLGYFFVALSIPNLETFYWVFSVVSIFIFYSKLSYFNPIYFIFGYKFYYIINSNQVKVLLITKKEIKIPKDIEFPTIKRINNYTFIEKG